MIYVSHLSKCAIAVLKNPSFLLKGGLNWPWWAYKMFLAQIEFERKGQLKEQFVLSLFNKEPQEVRQYFEEAKAVPLRLLYVITRVLKPEIVVETGVNRGQSSFSFLYALEQNRQGQLFSIELGKPGKLKDGIDYRLPREEIGCLVPPKLRDRWHLIWGDAKEELPPLLESLGTIDLFLHDSLHTEEHMMFEYETAWTFLREGGCLLSDNISVAFREFAKRKDRPYVCTLGMSATGGIRK